MNNYAQDYYELDLDRDIMRVYKGTDGLTILRNAADMALKFKKARFVTQVELDTLKVLNDRNRNLVWEILETPQGTLCLERRYIVVHHDADTVTITNWDGKTLDVPRYREEQPIDTVIKPQFGYQRFYATKGEARRALQRIVSTNPRFRSTWSLGVQVTRRQRDVYNALKYALYGDVVHFGDKSLVVARVCPTEVQFTDGTVMPILDVVKDAELGDTVIRRDGKGMLYVSSAGLEWLSSDELAQIAYARIVDAIGTDRPIYVLQMGEVREYFIKGLDGSTVLFTDGTGMSIFDITKPEQGVCSVWATTLGVCRALAYINGGAEE